MRLFAKIFSNIRTKRIIPFKFYAIETLMTLFFFGRRHKRFISWNFVIGFGPMQPIHLKEQTRVIKKTAIYLHAHSINADFNKLIPQKNFI